jgi:hypothetical protein
MPPITFRLLALGWYFRKNSSWIDESLVEFLGRLHKGGQKQWFEGSEFIVEMTVGALNVPLSFTKIFGPDDERALKVKT